MLYLTVLFYCIAAAYALTAFLWFPIVVVTFYFVKNLVTQNLKGTVEINVIIIKGNEFNKQQRPLQRDTSTQKTRLCTVIYGLFSFK